MAECIGFIGGGNMSTAIGMGILKNGGFPPSHMWVSGPNIKNLKHWAEVGVNVTDENGLIIEKCKFIFLGVKPHILQLAIDDCLKTYTPSAVEKVFISILAGITIEELQTQLYRLTKGAKVIRTMPNTPMLVGAGSCLYTGDKNTTSEELQKLEKYLNYCGLAEKVPESYIDSLGTLTGCGPAYMYIIIEALADGAVKQGVPRALALKFAAQMVIGSGKMVLDTKKHPGLLKDEVCSPGGSTICGVSVLEKGRIRSTLIEALEASTTKCRQMGAKK